MVKKRQLKKNRTNHQKRLLDKSLGPAPWPPEKHGMNLDWWHFWPTFYSVLKNKHELSFLFEVES